MARSGGFTSRPPPSWVNRQLLDSPLRYTRHVAASGRMVSIPDWSRFGALLAANKQQQSGQTTLSRYQRQRDREAVRQAEDSGYFFTPDKAFLAENCAHESAQKRKQRSLLDDEDKWREKQLQTIKLVKLVGVHLRQLGDVTLCRRLRVCRLGENHITRLDGLNFCRQLLWLDLHSNEISSLPGPQFWASLPHLLVVNLHDNPIGHISDIHSLAALPSLVALTLFNSPLSLKKNYRHHMVNTIWTLKALDRHVIADEEIIEDANFGGKFSACAPGFRIDLCPWSGEDVTYQEEMRTLRSVLSHMSRVLAYLSPVLVVQKVFRGYIVRRHLKARSDNRDWGAAVIQRWWRGIKGVPQHVGSDFTAPPPTRSPDQESAGRKSVGSNFRPPDSDFWPTGSDNRSLGSRAEFSMYITQQYRADSRASGIAPVADVNLPTPYNQEGEGGPEPSITKTRNLLIDLSKLQQGTLQTLDQDAVAIETVMGRRTIEFFADGHQRAATVPPPTAEKKRRKKKKKEKAPRRVKSVRQFFGPVVPVKKPDEESESESETEPEVPAIKFRLQGLKASVSEVDPTAEMLLLRRNLGRDIRHAEDEYHFRESILPRVKVAKPQRRTDIEKTFGRVFGTMSMSAGLAVEAAYKDRARAELRTSRSLKVNGIREDRDTAKNRVSVFMADKRQQAIRQRHRDKQSLISVAERRGLQQERYIDRVAERRSRTQLTLNTQRQDTLFAHEFGAQYTSVSNALQRHERQAQRQDKTAGRAHTVQAVREDSKEQSELVRRYLEHRQLMRQAESSLQRSALDARMLQQTTERLLEAKSRVDHQKAKTQQVEMFSPLAISATYPQPDKNPEEFLGLDRYESSVKMFEGRVGKHHTMVT